MKKRRLHRFILFVCFAAFSCSVAAQWHIIAGNPFKKAVAFDYPAYAIADKEKNIYLIDRSMKRILKLGSAGELKYAIDGGKPEKGKFFMADEIEADGSGNLYVLNTVLDADYAKVDREEIIKYDPDGNFDGVIRSVDYTKSGDKPMRKGRICALKAIGGDLFYFYKDKDSVALRKISLADHTDTLCGSIFIEDADSLLADIEKSAGSDLIAYTTKRGQVFKVEAGTTSLLYDGGLNGNGADPSIPWEIETDSKGNIYFTDLGRGEIVRINSDGTTTAELSEAQLPEEERQPGGTPFYRFEVADGDAIVTLAGAKVLYKNLGGPAVFYREQGVISLPDRAYALLVAGQLAAASALLLYFIGRLYRYAAGQAAGHLLKPVLFMILVILVPAGMVADMVFASFTGRYEKEVLHRLETATRLVSGSIDGDSLEKVDDLKDYMGRQYQSIREQVHGALTYNRADWSKGMYGVVYKVYDGRLYAFMYYDDSVGMKYPLPIDYMRSPHRQVYETGGIEVVKDSDMTGSWMYALGPIYNSEEEIVGIIEVGTDMYGFMLENRKLAGNIALDVATFLVVVILFMVEATLLDTVLVKRKREAGLRQSGDGYYDVRLVRPLGFVVFAAVYMGASFVPIMMKGLYQPIPGLPESVALGLPITAEMLFMAVASVMAGYMIDKYGWFRIFLGGVSILALGAFFSGLAWNAGSFIAARGIAGLGYGFSLISMQSYVMLSPTGEIKTEGISALNSGALAGMNCGVVIGAMAAERAGFSKVFYIAFAVALLAGIFALKYMSGVKGKPGAKGQVPEALLGPAGFLASPGILRLFLLVCIPMAVGVMFLNYFFPLYAEGLGVSHSNIGRAFLLNGLCIIYLGPVLSRFLLKNMGAKKSILLAGALAASGMLLFAAYGTLAAAFATVAFLGIAEGFGITARVTYYVGLEAVDRLGEGKAMGYYALAENAGQTIGPVVFGWTMALGAAGSAGIVGAALLALLALFAPGGFGMRQQKIENRL